RTGPTGRRVDDASAPSLAGGGSGCIERSEMRDGVGWRRCPAPHPARLRYAQTSDPSPPGEGEAPPHSSACAGSLVAPAPDCGVRDEPMKNTSGIVAIVRYISSLKSVA